MRTTREEEVEITDRKLDCEKKVLIVMDKIFQTGVNLSELRKNEGERRSEVDAKAEYVYDREEL